VIGAVGFDPLVESDESYIANIGNPRIRDLRSVGGSGAGAGPVANGGDIFGAGDA